MEMTCEFCGTTFEAQRSTARFCSEAHKKAAQRGASSPVTLVADDHAASEGRSDEGLDLDPGGEVSGDALAPGVRRPAISEAEYVEREAAQTRLAISRGLQDHDGRRIDRACAYARSRYRGFVAGEVASL